MAIGADAAVCQVVGVVGVGVVGVFNGFISIPFFAAEDKVDALAP